MLWAIGSLDSFTPQAQKTTAIGVTALDANTTGDDNVAMGYGALGANTTGNK